MYHARGYYLARAKPVYVYDRDSSTVRVILDVEEGNRVAIAQVAIEGNTHFTDEQIVAQMSSRPEGFWWFKSGEYDDDKLADDLRCHEKIVADGRHRRGAQHVEHRHDGRAPHVVRRRPALVGEAEQCDTRTVETTARLG